jgi:arylsulfatase A-like enzyme
VPTQPSFTTLYSGQKSITHGIVSHKGDRDLAENAPWLPSALRHAGKLTAAFCCLPHYKHWFIRGFEFVVNSTVRRTDYGFTAEVLNARAIPWLRAHAEEPFFMAVHYWDPHTPYLPPEKHRIFYEGDPRDPARENTLAPLERQFFSQMWAEWFRGLGGGIRDADYIVSLYDGEVRHSDEGVGELLAALDEAGVADDTLVFLTSDHGELFYRHDIFFDHHGLYDGNIHCPLIARLPGVTRPGTRADGFAQHEDLAPTVLASLGLPIPDAMDGVSLLPVFMGETPPAREFITAEECTWQRKWAIRTDTEKLILSRAPDFHGRPRREYFDLATDPDELRDLSTERPDRADALEARLEDWIAEMVARNGLPGDPLLTEDITLGKKWEEWLNAGGAEARE